MQSIKGQKRRLRFATLWVLTVSLVGAGCVSEQYSEITEPKNILLIVADDMGTYDIGAFGSEIRTPNIDELANNGLRFTDFHTSATCSPTRSMLMSGADSHAAGIGNMIEHVSPNQKDQPGYEGHLSDRVVSVATLLQDAGYNTLMAGKWHLGMTSDLLPTSRGFNQAFSLLQGGSSYFNDMKGLNSIVQDAHYRHNGEVVEELPEDFYASEFYTDFILDHLKENEQSNQPFFAYLSYTAPHWPLQVKDEHIDLYKGDYDQGYEILRDERISSAIAAGLLPSDVEAAQWPHHVKPWDELNEQEKKVESRTMEVYSAVVERMDFHLGRVLDYLEESGQLDNTLIVFMSDNGADGSDRSKLPGNDWWLPQDWDLSYENMGKIGSYVYPGAAWAQTSVGPYSLYKEFLAQGGIKTPMILTPPRNQSDGLGGISERFTTVKDIAPTILEYAGIPHPGNSYKGKEVAPLEGESLLALASGVEMPSDTDKVMGWELFGQKAIRQGDWKLLWLSSAPGWLVPPRDTDKWMLFNLEEDPGEANDLADTEPEKLAQMQELWEAYFEEQSVIIPVWN